MPDTDRPHWTWLVAGAIVVVAIALCTPLLSARRLVRRARAVLGTWLIDAGAALVPDPPADPVADDRRAARIVAEIERRRAAKRRNGQAPI